jgi:hypothetical protein
MLFSRSIPALFGGVSQQPATQRSAHHLEEMVNCRATIVDGIGKRPPSEHVARLTDEAVSSAFIHTINRDISERYVVIVTNGDLKVYDNATGAQKSVSFHHGKTYLNVPPGRTAEDTFALVTVADYTFVVNKTVAVELDALGADKVGQPVDFWNLNRKNTTGAAEQWQYPPNVAEGTYKGEKQTLQDLPEVAPEGDTYLIRSSVETGFTGYHVRRTQGVWIEVPKNGLKNALNARTMPWALVRMGDGTFQFAPFSWAPRRVGDEVTNPVPTFVGRTINDVYFVKNRLALTVDENTLMSRAGDFGNFWRMSAIDQFDDDYIDVAATETKVTKLLYAVPMNGDVMLFADQVQFRLNTGEVLTPNSCSLDVTTQYPMALKVRPAPLGSDIYFGSEEGDWVRLMEYFVKDESNTTDAADITSHVPRYVPKGLRQIVPSAAHDEIFLLTRGAPNRIYTYKFYWSSPEEKSQSAWGYWEFANDTEVLSGSVLDSYLVCILKRPDGLYLERIPLGNTATAPSLPFEVYLDRRFTRVGTYLDVIDRTAFSLPYPVPAAQRSSFRIVRGGAFGAGKGGLLDNTQYEWVSDTEVRVPGNFASHACILGKSYKQRWTFSEWFMLGRNDQPDLQGRLQIRTVTLYYTRTGYFRTEVSPYGGAADVETIIPAKLAEFTGKTLGDAALLVGDPQFDTGAYSFQVYGNSADARISITNDSHLGSWFTSAEVEFFWQKRARFV